MLYLFVFSQFRTENRYALFLELLWGATRSENRRRCIVYDQSFLLAG